MCIFRIFSSVLFLSAVVLSIPLAFDVGGRTCGLAFSLSLSAFYFFLSLLKLTTPTRSIIRKTCIFLISSTQWLIVPALLIWSLNRFSIDSNGSGSWVERAFTTLRARNSSVRQWVFGQDGLLEAAILGFWDKLLVWSMPVFQLAEGFCSLLVIQASGQITRYLVNKSGRSDSWMVCIACLFGIQSLFQLSRLTPNLLRLDYLSFQHQSYPARCTFSGVSLGSLESATSTQL